MLMMGQKLTPEQRLDKAYSDILSHERYTALAGVLMIGKREVCDKTPTACTNGRDCKYGRAFIESINDAQLRFLVLHETYHKLYRHLTTWRHLYDKDAQRANQACDYVINLRIMDDNEDEFAEFIEGGLINRQFKGMNAQEVFNALPEQPEGGQGNGDGDGTLDEHDWDSADEMSAEEVEQLAQDIDEAVRQGAMTAGKMGANVPSDFEQLMQPQVNWRDVLREFITETCAGSDYSTWARPNRRYIGAGHYLPSGVSERVDELVLAIDTSGSVFTPRELSLFLSEVVGVCELVQPERVRLLYWGHEVVGDEVYESADIHTLPESTKPSGGGGTDVECVTQYMADKQISAQACIVLTDGYLFGGWGEWSMPVLWAILDNKSAVPTVGKALHIKSGDI